MNRTLVGITLISLSCFASAQSSFSKDGRPEHLFHPGKGVNAADRNFVQGSAKGNAFEIEISKLAAKRSKSAWTKEFAKEMIHEHSGAQTELTNISKRRGLRLNTSPTAEQWKTIQRLQGLKGTKFDTQYRKVQLMAHAQTAAMFQNYIARGHDEDVKGYAVKVLPAVKMHYRMALNKKTMMHR